MGGQAIADGAYHCTGFFVDGSEKTAMAMDMTVDGLSLTGQGVDAVSTFTISGTIAPDGLTVTFHKKYETHEIEYYGLLDDGTKLLGQWKYPSCRPRSGTFELVLEKVNAVDVVERAQWKGHYAQFGNKYETAQELVVYTTGRIEGSGCDSFGEFTITGRFLDDGATTGRFIYTKKYETYAISYEGVRTGDVMEGIYQSVDTGRDEFKFQKHASS